MVVRLVWECQIGMEGIAGEEEFPGFSAVLSGLLDLDCNRFA
jgi:hypothetical protein